MKVRDCRQERSWVSDSVDWLEAGELVVHVLILGGYCNGDRLLN